MGLELKKCKAEFKGATATGRLYLDSKDLEFRSPDIRWSIKIGKGTNAKAVDGSLVVRRGSKTATFNVGQKVDKWVEKILNPPTRGKKLGLKPELRFVLRGDFDSSFEKELRNQKLIAACGPKSCDIAFLMVEAVADLKRFDQIFKACRDGVHIWVVWPKGIDAIGQSDVFERARQHGLGPGKKIAFDDTFSAMRFTKK